jgi:hypothetical protein
VPYTELNSPPVFTDLNASPSKDMSAVSVASVAPVSNRFSWAKIVAHCIFAFVLVNHIELG